MNEVAHMHRDTTHQVKLLEEEEALLQSICDSLEDRWTYVVYIQVRVRITTLGDM